MEDLDLVQRDEDRCGRLVPHPAASAVTSARRYQARGPSCAPCCGTGLAAAAWAPRGRSRPRSPRWLRAMSAVVARRSWSALGAAPARSATSAAPSALGYAHLAGSTTLVYVAGFVAVPRLVGWGVDGLVERRGCPSPSCCAAVGVAGRPRRCFVTAVVRFFSPHARSSTSARRDRVRAAQRSSTRTSRSLPQSFYGPAGGPATS